MKFIARDVATMGGLASRLELQRRRHSRDTIDLALWYHDVITVRRGWYASVDTDPEVLRAWTMGGRLACVSAARHRGLAIPEGGPLHIAVARNASRLRFEPGTVVHWVDPGRLDLIRYENRAATTLDDALGCIATCKHARSARVALLTAATDTL